MAAPTKRAKNTNSTSAVFDCLFHSPRPLTKQEVAAAVGVSLPTAYQAFNELDAKNLIASGEDRQSTGGRRANTFAIANESHAAIGVQITRNKIKYVVCDLRGERFEQLCGETQAQTPYTVEALNQELQSIAASVTAKATKEGLELVGMGVGLPSPIDPTSGKLLNTSVLKLAESDVNANDLVAGIELPAQVFNDADCGAFSQFFPNHANRSLVYLSLERGVGGSVFIDGKPLSGTRGLAGELGHICIEEGGKPCNCGKKGCLEAYCSSAALSDELGCTIDEFFERTEAHDAAALETLDSYIDHLARGIQTIRTILDCPVALGGKMSSYLVPFFEKISERVNELDPFAKQGEPFVVFANHPFHGVAFGAAEQMIERYINEL